MIIAVDFPVWAVGGRRPGGVGASAGFGPVASAMPVRCSAGWAVRPRIGSEVNLLSSYLPVRSEMI